MMAPSDCVIFQGGGCPDPLPPAVSYIALTLFYSRFDKNLPVYF